MLNAEYIADIPRPMPRVNRPPERRCIVVAQEAVISGWRVLQLVAGVAMFMLVVTAQAAPTSDDASLTFQRSDMNAVPKPSSSPRRACSTNAAGPSPAAPPSR